METIPMKIVSIKRLVLSLALTLGSVMTLPAYAWPDTDEMNMCGAAIKTVQNYAGDHRSWAAHDNYIAQRGKTYYQRTNCPQSKATKNYKGKNWTPDAKIHKKHMHKKHSKNMHKRHMKHHGHNPKHKNHADCVRTDRLNNAGITKNNAARYLHKDAYKADYDFYRQAQAVLNMSRVKQVSKMHNPKHKNHADCVRTDGLNNTGAIVKVIR